MTKYFFVNAVIQGSCKVPNFTHAVELLDVGQFEIKNNPTPYRTGDRKQSTQFSFSSLELFSSVSGDTALALVALGKGQNIKEVNVQRVQAIGKDNVVESTINFGKLNGATYVKSWKLFYDPEQATTTSGLWYRFEIITDGVETSSNMVGQDQQAKGVVSTAFSTLNQQKV